MRKDKFYSSKAWRTVRKTYALSKSLICERCGCVVYYDGVSEYKPISERPSRAIVHHKIYLNESTYSDPNISLNMDNLELLCKDCHEKEHTTRKAIRKEYMFDEQGNLIPKRPAPSKNS